MAADAIRLVAGVGTEAGLTRERIPLYGGEAFREKRRCCCPQMGAAAEGIRQLDSYCPALETPENQAFLKLTRAAGQYPSENNFYGWSAAQTLWEAMDAVGGKVEDTEALVKALERVRYVGPMGSFPLRRESQPDPRRLRAGGFARSGGELHNVCVDKVTQVGHPADIPFPPK
jgi:branched-chain amino acid transport system substrate-binding protein